MKTSVMEMDESKNNSLVEQNKKNLFFDLNDRNIKADDNGEMQKIVVDKEAENDSPERASVVQNIRIKS